MTRMPFGKFQGMDLGEVPDDYFSWLIEHIDLRQPLRGAIEDEMRRRRLRPQTSEIILRIQAADLPVVREVVDRGLKSAALIHHPDRGGNVITMQRLNRVVGSLRTQLAAIEGQRCSA